MSFVVIVLLLSTLIFVLSCSKSVFEIVSELNGLLGNVANIFIVGDVLGIFLSSILFSKLWNVSISFNISWMHSDVMSNWFALYFELGDSDLENQLEKWDYLKKKNDGEREEMLGRDWAGESYLIV